MNALAILIFLAQLPELANVTWLVYPLVAAGLAIIYLFPLLTKAIPSPLVAIVALTAATLLFGFDVRTIGAMGALPDSLPTFVIPDVPLEWRTLEIILPYSLVGLLESMMTAAIVDELTDSKSSRNRECVGQGVANIASGFIGGTR